MILLALAQMAAQTAQAAPPPAQQPMTMPMHPGCCGMMQPTPPPAAAWDPAAQYITVGQDEPGYRAWYGTTALHPIQVKAFNDYLTQWGVAGILPTWQLLRTATAWEHCGAQPFEVPPTAEWPHIVQTLRYIRDYVIPTVGPVEPVSGYRNPALNVCAGGAPESAHMHYSAVDLVPLKQVTRVELMRELCEVHGRRGLDYGVGLGFYAFLRFHVDTTKYRRWNMDPAVANECPPIIKPADVATVGQPVVVPAPGSGTVPLGTVSEPVKATSGPLPSTPSPPSPNGVIPAAPPTATPQTPSQPH